MKNSRMLIATAAVLGLCGGQVSTTAAQLRPAEQRQLAAVNNGSTHRELKADVFGRYAMGMLSAITRDGGHTPYEWGISRACARMVRKNRMHACGIGHARI